MHQYIEFFSSHPMLSLIWIFLFGALVVISVKQKISGYNTLTPNEATLLLNRHDGVIFDTRSQDEYRKGHITDAVHVPLSEIQGGRFTHLEKYKNTPIIVMCKNGQTAGDSATRLIKAGFTQVSVLKDGLISWNEAKLPLIQGKK